MNLTTKHQSPLVYAQAHTQMATWLSAFSKDSWTEEALGVTHEENTHPEQLCLEAVCA